MNDPYVTQSFVTITWLFGLAAVLGWLFRETLRHHGVALRVVAFVFYVDAVAVVAAKVYWLEWWVINHYQFVGWNKLGPSPDDSRQTLNGFFLSWMMFLVSFIWVTGITAIAIWIAAKQPFTVERSGAHKTLKEQPLP